MIGSGRRNITDVLEETRRRRASKVCISDLVKSKRLRDRCANYRCLDNARCNVYDGDMCCEDLYCHELPNSKGVCKLIGH